MEPCPRTHRRHHRHPTVSGVGPAGPRPLARATARRRTTFGSLTKSWFPLVSWSSPEWSVPSRFGCRPEHNCTQTVQGSARGPTPVPWPCSSSASAPLPPAASLRADASSRLGGLATPAGWVSCYSICASTVLYNAESPKQGSKRFNSQVKTKHFAHLGL